MFWLQGLNHQGVPAAKVFSRDRRECVGGVVLPGEPAEKAEKSGKASKASFSNCRSRAGCCQDARVCPGV